MSKTRSLFLDRDGVINLDEGYTFRIEDFKFIDGIFDLCRAAKQKGYVIIVVTNQAGIGRGYYSGDDFLSLTEWMCRRFEVEGTPLMEVFFCPDHPEYGIGPYRKDSFNRKPNPGMLLSAAEIYSIDMGNSVMIGDKDSDMVAAARAGVGIRCHYLPCGSDPKLSSAATHCIHQLRQAIPLLTDAGGRLA